MRVISQPPPPNGRRRRYDWAVILDGQLRELEWGVDFDCRPSSFEVTIRRAAHVRDKDVRVHNYVRPDDHRPVLAVQASKRDA